MGKKGETKKTPKPAKTVEGREGQLINLAIKLAEKQLAEGTASSQVISHFLKLGSTKDILERKILEKQEELMQAKTDALKSAKNTEELYRKALEAMKTYGGDR